MLDMVSIGWKELVAGCLPRGQTLGFKVTASVLPLVVATKFMAGISIPLFVLFIGIPILGRLGAFDGVAFRLPLTLVGVALMLGGFVCGGVFGQGWRGRVAMGVAFVVSLWPVIGVIATLTALTGNEGLVAVGVRYTPPFMASFLLIGVIGTLCIRAKSRYILRNGIAGALAGTVGGVLATLTTQVLHLTGLYVAAVGTLCAVVACFASAALTGWWFRWDESA